VKTTALIANGEFQNSAILVEKIKTCQRIVAVDGGLKYCHAIGIAPDRICGDFDSCPPALLEHYPNVPLTQLQKDKDKTDLEVAIESEIDQCDFLVIFGGWGLRIDHSLTNALILTRYPGRITLETENELLFALQPSSRLHCTPGQTLSLIPMNGPATGITTSGLKWELSNKHLDSHFVGISNVCRKSMIDIQFIGGSLLCCLQKI